MIYPQQASLGHLTGLASRLFNRLLTQRFKQAGIDMTAEQWGVILLMSNSAQPLSQTELAEMLYLEKSSVSRSLDGLLKREWIVRQVDSSDSRKKRVMLTPQAQQIAAQCAAIAEGVLQDAQHGQSPTGLIQSHLQLSGVIDNLRGLIGDAESSSTQ